MKKRFWEIDFLRGIAIIMMIIFHFMWNLNFFYNHYISLLNGFWGVFQTLTASLFLFLVGVSLAISKINKRSDFIRYLKKGLKILSLGLIITIVTWRIFPDSFIIFGVLHLIGVSIIISYFFRKFKYMNLLFGIIFIIIGSLLQNYRLDFNWLLLFGLHSNTFYSIDYFPIFPWFGVVLIGIFSGKLLYSTSKRNFQLKDLSNLLIVKAGCFLGKRSLIIYLIHQIILYGAFLIIATVF